MTDFRHRHAGTARDGRHVIIKGQPYTYTPPPGFAGVCDDNKTYFYRVHKGERREFRVWLADVFGGMNCRKVRGAWPNYTIKDA